MKKVALTFVAAALLAAPAAFAQERPAPPEPRPAPPTGRVEPAGEGGGEKEFGNPGVLAIGGDTTANFSYNQTSPPSGSSTNTIDLGIRPNVQYFVIEGLSVGGTILFDWAKPNQGDATTTIGIGPTVGYNLWLSPGSLSLWPQANFTFANSSTTIQVPNGTGGTTSASGSIQTMSVGVFVPLLIHPVKHFHFGVGPIFNMDVSSKLSSGNSSTDGDKNMTIGIAAEVAGWL